MGPICLRDDRVPRVIWTNLDLISDPKNPEFESSCKVERGYLCVGGAGLPIDEARLAKQRLFTEAL